MAASAATSAAGSARDAEKAAQSVVKRADEGEFDGAPGAKGDPGTAATITVGTTTTLPAGSNATVTQSGTAQNAVLSFGIPKGADGPGGGGGAPVRTVLWEGEVYGDAFDTIQLSDNAKIYRILYILTDDDVIPIFTFGWDLVSSDPNNIPIKGSLRHLMEHSYDSIDVGFIAEMSADGETLSNIYAGRVESYYFNPVMIRKIIGEK